MKGKFIYKAGAGLILGLVFLIWGCAKKVSITPEQVEQVFSRARASYQELLSYNPPEGLTYHYRSLMSQAEQARAKKNLKSAMELAQKAEEQARLANQAWQAEISKIREDLNLAKEKLEALFPFHKTLVKRYWELEARFAKRQFEELGTELAELLKEIDQTNEFSLAMSRTMVVSAPAEYLAFYGNVRIYKEITSEGKLKEVVATVAPGVRVEVVRIKLFSPELNFYLVKVPDSDTQGWMAEKYLISEGRGY